MMVAANFREENGKLCVTVAAAGRIVD